MTNLEVGDYVVIKDQHPAAIVKKGGCLMGIHEDYGVVTDGVKNKVFLLSSLQCLRPEDIPITGVTLKL
jgi:hypothetical protein